MPRSTYRWLPLAAAFALVALAGCDREEIQSYTVPRPSVGDAKVKLLAAVFDVGDNDQWYFKLLGPKDDVEAHAGAFVKFVESVRFLKDPKKPVLWDEPGWEEGKPKDKQMGGYATFYPDPKDHRVELTVSKLGKQSELLENVNRWCDRDLGRPHLRHRDVVLEDRNADLVTRIRAGESKGVLVKLDGPGSKRVKGPMGKDKSNPHGGLPMLGGKAPNVPFTYTVPEGWVERGSRPLVANSWAVRDGDRSASAEISGPHGAHFGDVLENVNRWRGQVGLAPVKAIEPKPASLEVSGKASEYYDFVGPKGRSLVVIVRRPQETWFFKLIGDAQLVGDNRAPFESFVQSVKFPGAAE